MGKKKDQKRAQIKEINQIYNKQIQKNDIDDKIEISDEQFQITLMTLQHLGNNLKQYRQPKYKQLRASLYPFIQDKLQQEGKQSLLIQKPNLNVQIVYALENKRQLFLIQRYLEALQLLKDYRNSKQEIKLGTIQRWVREVMLNTLKPKPILVSLIDAILRCQPQYWNTQESLNHEGVINYKNEWQPCQLQNLQNLEQIQFSDNDFRLIYFQQASDRDIKNKYDLSIYSNNIELNLNSNQTLPNVQNLKIPSIPNAFCLINVLSQQDCNQIISLCEKIGFRPDMPEGQDDDRAMGCVLLATNQLNDFLYERCKNALPQDLNGQLLGLNARWRIYRYFEGNTYRPHIDGAWPGSGMRNEQYVYDYFEDRWSKLTFILYLNEGFEGGHTTFFVPGENEGSLEAKSVQPRIGTVLCFPHGETNESLVHEGSAVLQGCKYIVRTDVLYKK